MAFILLDAPVLASNVSKTERSFSSWTGMLCFRASSGVFSLMREIVSCVVLEREALDRQLRKTPSFNRPVFSNKKILGLGEKI